ncbi:MAG TPA: CoA-binding protein, partial [Ktedonobacteraceae bacterium]|nr:CoA-binding protein [Ktedonobacteraceae bacterium]
CGARRQPTLADKSAVRTVNRRLRKMTDTRLSNQFRKAVGIDYMKDMAPDMYDRLQILQTYRHVAIVGISADTSRPSHFVAIYLKAEGYHIVLVNPRYAGQTILGQPVYASLAEAKTAGELIEIVDVFRRPKDVPPVAEEAIQVGAKVLWLQLGIRNEEAAQRAQQAGLIVVQDRCIKIEHARFFGGLHTVGLNTGVIMSKKLE